MNTSTTPQQQQTNINQMYNNYFTSTASSSSTTCSSNSTPVIQQQQFSPQAFSTSTPTNMMDDWLNPCAVASNNDFFSSFKQQQEQDVAAFQDLLQLLPISPPLTASPVSSEGYDANTVSAEAALVALFPDILNTATTSVSNLPPPRPVVQVQPQPRRLAPVIAPKPAATVAIMPKPNVVPIAPRPSSAGAMYTPTITTSNNKRKIESNSGEGDEIAQKRQKNTDAARRSRLKKIVKMECLEKQVNELESDNSRLTTRVAVLESEKCALIEKDKGLEDRIRVLEAQLAEAHRALTCKSSAA
jgi:hypothetical protein